MENTLRVQRALKGKRGVTQHDVVKSTGIERNCYYRIESGLQPPTPDQVRKLARYFRVRASVLFPSLATTTSTNGASA